MIALDNCPYCNGTDVYFEDVRHEGTPDNICCVDFHCSNCSKNWTVEFRPVAYFLYPNGEFDDTRHLLPQFVEEEDLPVGPRHEPIPKNFPVQPLKPGQHADDKATCGHCGLSWDDAISTSWTPAPSARCPFEYFHI